jgi:hypothetical protein
VLGPIDAPSALEKAATVEAGAGLELCRALVQHIALKGYLPTSLSVSGVAVGPGALLRGIASALLRLARELKSEQFTFTPGAEEPAAATSLVEEGIYRMLPGWPPHKPDLRLDQLALHTRLQCWSLKPATPS